MTIITTAILTLAVVLTWVVLAMALAGIGVLFLNRFIVTGIEPSWEYVVCGIWTGLGLTLAGLMLWHFILPVNEVALAVFAGAAALALIGERRWFAAVLRLPRSRLFTAAAIVFATWTANHALASGWYDDYTYEFQTVRWFYQYPIVPGLANLHGRLGFNNSHHLFAAMLSAGPLKGGVNHIFNGFFIVLTCLFLLNAVRELAQGAKGALERTLFPSLLLCPCAGLVVFGTFGPMIATLKADVFVCVASVFLASVFIRWAATPSHNAARPALAATTLIVGCIIPGVKLNGLVFCGVLVAAVLFVALQQSLQNSQRWKELIAPLVVGFVLLACVPLRGVILSGYPFYPLTRFGLNVEWRVPGPLAQLEAAIITSFGRLPLTDNAEADVARYSSQVEEQRASLADLRTPFDPRRLLGRSWIWRWARSTAFTDRINILLPLLLALATIPALFAHRRSGGRANKPTPGWAYATVAVASVSALIVWFIQAPAGRFILANVWILFASILAWAIQKGNDQWSWRVWLGGLLVTLIVAAIALFGGLRLRGGAALYILTLLVFAASWLLLFGLFVARHPRRLAALCLLLPLFPYAEYLVSGRSAAAKSVLGKMFLAHPLPAVTLRRTCSGLEVYEVPYAAFATPLPNTLQFNPFLQLRTGRMEDGFFLHDCGITVK